MIVPTAARLIAVSFLLAAAVAPCPAPAAERLAEVDGWTVYSDAHPDGRPYCYAGAERGAGDRITLLRGDPGLVVILSRAAWPATAAELDVVVTLDEAPAFTQSGTLRNRSLVLVRDDAASARRALSAASALHLRDEALGSRWRLDGAAAALAALEPCFTAGLDELAEARGAWRAVFAESATQRAAEPQAPSALAADFARWLAHAGGVDTAEAVVTARDDEVFALNTHLGAGGLRLLAGASHPAVREAGAAWLAAVCPMAGEIAERERQDVEGVLVARLTLACDAASRFEALVVSYRDDPGGFLLAVPAADGRGAALTAALRDDLLASGATEPATPPVDAPS